MKIADHKMSRLHMNSQTTKSDAENRYFLKNSITVEVLAIKPAQSSKELGLWKPFQKTLTL